MTTLTLEEQERRAYANGDVRVATLLANALDAKAEATDLEITNAREKAYDEGRDDGYEEGFEDGKNST